MQIKILTLHAPWAQAIFLGKDIENRGWGTSYRGELWIHCGQTIDLDGMAFLEEMGVDPPDLKTTRGMLLGRVDLTDCGMEKCLGNPWAMPGQYHLKLENPQRLKQPIPLSGKLGIWSRYVSPDDLELE